MQYKKKQLTAAEIKEQQLLDEIEASTSRAHLNVLSNAKF
jgi:hypothetical protein